MLATCIGAAVGAIRARQMKKFNEMSRIAYVSQGAVLRPLGPKVGPLDHCGAIHLRNDAADIGGDLYEALDTPYGVRMIIGDVRGKGIEAVRLASIVLGSFRHVAYERADLRAIVADLDRAVARSVGDEDFVTAALVEERGGTLTDRQLWTSGAAAAPPRRGHPSGSAVKRAAARLHAGGTDRGSSGSSPATGSCCSPTDWPRRAGTAQFFPTAERAGTARAWHRRRRPRLAGQRPLRLGRGQVDDDIALVLSSTPGRTRGEPPVPSWEIGGAAPRRSAEQPQLRANSGLERPAMPRLREPVASSGRRCPQLRGTSGLEPARPRLGERQVFQRAAMPLFGELWRNRSLRCAGGG